MSDDELSNTASEYFRRAFVGFTERGPPREEVVRAWLTDDFAYEDRRRGPNFCDTGAESFPKVVSSMWETETLAVRGERFAAVAVQADYGKRVSARDRHRRWL